MGIIFTIVLVVIGFGVAISILKKQSAGEKVISEEILKENLVDGMKDLSFTREFELKNDFLRQLRIMHCGDSREHNGILEGVYKDTRFLAESIRCTETSRDSDGDESTSTVFIGEVLILDLSLTTYEKPVRVCRGYGFFNSKAVTILDNPRYYASSENDTLVVNGEVIELIKSLKEDRRKYNFAIYKDYLVIAIDNDRDMLFSHAYRTKSKEELRKYVTPTLKEIAHIVDFFTHGEDKRVVTDNQNKKCKSCGANLEYSDAHGGYCCPYCGATVTGIYHETRGSATMESMRQRFTQVSRQWKAMQTYMNRRKSSDDLKK